MRRRHAPRAAAQIVTTWLVGTFRPASSRMRLRRRLYLISAPVLVVLSLTAAKMIGVGLAGNSAVSDFARHDIDALRQDVSFLGILDVINPAKTSLAAGDLNVIEGRLQDAENRFAESLSRTGPEQSCQVRINLLLVRETLGDLAARAGQRKEAELLYGDAIAVAGEAPPGCFDGNADPSDERRAIRADAVPRLRQKLDLLTPATSEPLPGLPPSNPVPASAPAPAPSSPPSPGPRPNMPELPQTGIAQGPAPGPDDGGGEDAAGRGPLSPISPDRIPAAGGGDAPGHRLGTGDPLERLRILLDNSNAYGDNRE